MLYDIEVVDSIATQRHSDNVDSQLLQFKLYIQRRLPLVGEATNVFYMWPSGDRLFFLTKHSIPALRYPFLTPSRVDL